MQPFQTSVGVGVRNLIAIPRHYGGSMRVKCPRWGMEWAIPNLKENWHRLSVQNRLNIDWIGLHRPLFVRRNRKQRRKHCHAMADLSIRVRF